MAREGQMTVDTMTDGCKAVLKAIKANMTTDNGSKQFPQGLQKNRVRLAYVRYCLGETSYEKAIQYAFNLTPDEYAKAQLSPNPNKRPRFKMGTIVADIRRDLEKHADESAPKIAKQLGCKVGVADVTLPAIAVKDRRKGGRGGAGGFGSNIFG